MIDFYIQQIKNEYEKFRPYSWHLLYCKKNNAVQKFRLSVNSVSCSFRGNQKKKKEKQIMNLLLDAMSRSIPPETTSAGQSSVRGSGAVHAYSGSAPALSFVLWL